MEFHEYANIFPLLEDADIRQLADSIKANGLRHKITTYEGKILDGRNRYKACLLAGVDPGYREYKGKDPIAFVIDENLHRRHLNESQRAMAAARAANLKRGEFHGNQHVVSANLPIPPVSQASAAAKFNVSERSVRDAKTVQEKTIPAVMHLVDQGKLAVSEAKKLAGQENAVQKRFAEKVESGVKPTEARRQIVSESYATKTPELNKAKKYRVIYADPPWQYGNTNVTGFVEQRDHYQTMLPDEIAAMPIKDITEDDAVLFLWVTSPILEDSFRVIHGWGFNYKASFVWDKVSHVMGHYNSVRHELLLICTKGSCLPDVKKLYDSVYSEERGEHSAKPAFFRDMIDTIYPNGNRIELFARQRSQGWDVYGNDLPER